MNGLQLLEYNNKKRDELERQLRVNLKAKSAELAELLELVSDHWGYEDPVYRFYHGSFKVYDLQIPIEKIAAVLKSLLPKRPLNKWFTQIVAEGTGKRFKYEDNEHWLAITRPIVEAFFHARYFLEMACRYSEPPPEGQSLPSGWAALLYLFDIR